MPTFATVAETEAYLSGFRAAVMQSKDANAELTTLARLDRLERQVKNLEVLRAGAMNKAIPGEPDFHAPVVMVSGVQFVLNGVGQWVKADGGCPGYADYQNAIGALWNQRKR